MWKMHVSSIPAPELDFIRYVCMVDDSRARSAMGYEHQHDLDSTLHAIDAGRWVGST